MRKTLYLCENRLKIPANRLRLKWGFIYFCLVELFVSQKKGGYRKALNRVGMILNINFYEKFYF